MTWGQILYATATLLVGVGGIAIGVVGGPRIRQWLGLEERPPYRVDRQGDIADDPFTLAAVKKIIDARGGDGLGWVKAINEEAYAAQGYVAVRTADGRKIKDRSDNVLMEKPK